MRPSWFEAVAVYLFYLAVVARTLSWTYIQHLLPWYLLLEGAYLVLFSLVLWRLALSTRGLSIYFGVQSALILGLYALWPKFNFVVLLFVPLSYQAALLLRGKARPAWILGMVTLIGVSMTALQGIPGLAEGMMNMAGCVVLPAYVIARLEIQAARRQSQAMLAELEQAHQKLKEYASQAEELASLQERNRLARELHDSTSQSLFSIVFTTRTAQILLERDPEQARAQLQELKNLTQNALVGMRAFITQLKPK